MGKKTESENGEEMNFCDSFVPSLFSPLQVSLTELPSVLHPFLNTLCIIMIHENVIIASNHRISKHESKITIVLMGMLPASFPTVSLSVPLPLHATA